jgi:hypothetical protein
MDDYSSLAHRIAGGVADVRGCLILSRDGLILGSFPEDESVVKPSWLRFAALGEPERSFVEFAGEVWAYLRRGPYAAFAIAGIGVRPGLLLDQLEQVLMAAEEARTRRETLKVPESPASLSGKPRTSLHPPAGSPLEPAAAGADPRPWSRGTRPEENDLATTPSLVERGAAATDAPVATATGADGRADEKNGDGSGSKAAAKGDTKGAKEAKDAKDEPKLSAAGAEGRQPAEPLPDRNRGEAAAPDGKKRKKDEERPAEPVAEPSASPEGGKPSDGDRAGASLELEPDAEVDRVLLAKEFSGLLQVEAADDEAQS